MVVEGTELPIVAAVALRRGDGRVLLVRHAHASHPGAAEGRWTLPAEPVADDEVVETALARLLEQRLHLTSDEVEFSESVGLPGAIANVFACAQWAGDPAYSADDYGDAAWAAPHAPGAVDLVEGVRTYLANAFPAPAPPPQPAVPAVAMPHSGEPKNLIRREATPAPAPAVWSMTPDDLVAELEEAREALTAAYARFDEAWLDVTLDGEWAPVDLLAHCATVEAYYAAESRRLAEEPGHTWRGFNPDQAEAERAGLARPENRVVRARLQAIRVDTLSWIESLDANALAAYGNHAERGAVRIGERIQQIANHDRAHTEQLAAMLAATEADDEDAE
ncbi:MAG: DinB family protein [Chloroflexi bacterium]|nr:DinB family protein [Chloroflexota bacterium]